MESMALIASLIAPVVFPQLVLWSPYPNKSIKSVEFASAGSGRFGSVFKSCAVFLTSPEVYQAIHLSPQILARLADQYI